MKLSLNDSICSSQDLKEVILAVRAYSQWLSNAAVKKSVTSQEASEAPAMSKAVTDIINQWYGNEPVTQKSLDGLITGLEEFEATAQKINITLAAPAPNSLKKTLLAWCRANISPNILVDFQYNSTMLGGMVVRYGSHVYDWSFRRQIMASINKFPEVLRNV